MLTMLPIDSIVPAEDNLRRRIGDVTRRGCVAPSVSELSAFAGYRFPPEVILLAVRWHLRFGLSYRDLEELLAERGIDVDHVTATGGRNGSYRC